MTTRDNVLAPTETNEVIRSSDVMRMFIQAVALLVIPGTLAWPISAQQQVRVTITGVVQDVETGTPLATASIELNGRSVGATDQSGFFRIEAALTAGSTHRLVATRIGYQQVQWDFIVEAGTPTVEVVLELVPVPVQLPDINIEGEAELMSVANLAGFDRRRQNSPGHFFTREDIQRIGALRLTEIVRRVPGSVIYSPDNVFVDISNPTSAGGAQEQRTSITFQRSGFSRGAPCEALVFVNDVQVRDNNIDWLVDARSIVAMEVYTGTSQIPGEYNKMGADCGVVVVWTDAPTRRRGPGFATGFEVGWTFTARMRGGFEGERFGIQMMVPLFGAVEFHPSFHLIVGNSRQGDAGWQLLTALKARPFGPTTPWYLGTGITVVKNRTSFFDSGRLTNEDTEFMPVGLTGMSLPLGPIRPFIEFQLLDPFGDQDGYIATGLTVLQR